MSVVALAVAAVGPPPGMLPPAPPPDAAQNYTSPAIDYSCSVVGQDGAVRRMAFHFSGTQGYPTGGIPAFASTKATFVVTTDETRTFASGDELYDNYGLQRIVTEQGRRERLGRSLSGNRWSFVRFREGQQGKAAITVEWQSPPFGNAMPDFPYAGICAMTEIHQRPLDKAPPQKDRGQ